MDIIVCKSKKLFFILTPLVILFTIDHLQPGFCSDKGVIAKGVDWNYALIGLAVRFIGVFAVLGILQATIQVAGWLLRRRKRDNKNLQTEKVSQGLTSQEVAAVSIALHLYRRQR
jgi:hypothetical protein